MFPHHEIAAAGVAPVHVAPAIAVGIVLVVDVVVILVVKGAVGIVHPVAGRDEVEDRARAIRSNPAVRLGDAGHGVGHGVIEEAMDLGMGREGDLIDADVAPAAGVFVHDLEPCLLAQIGEEIPDMPVQALGFVAGGGLHDLAVDEEVDADLAGKIAAAEQHVDVGQGDGEFGRGERAGGLVAADVGIDEAASEKAGDGLLVGQRAARGAGAKGFPGDLPVAPVRALEVREDDFVGGLARRGEALALDGSLAGEEEREQPGGGEL
jgi:hypothetical protein